MKKSLNIFTLSIIIFFLGCGGNHHLKEDTQFNVQNFDQSPIEKRNISKKGWKEFSFDFSETDRKGLVTFYTTAPGLGKMVAFNVEVYGIKTLNVPKNSKVDITLDEGNFLFILSTIRSGYSLDFNDVSKNAPFGNSSMGIVSLTEGQKKTYLYTCPLTDLGTGKVKIIIPDQTIDNGSRQSNTSTDKATEPTQE